MVYVINEDGNPLMPCSSARARHLLKAHEASVKSRDPFIIQLFTVVPGNVQPIVVGVDLGAKTVGLAAVGLGRVLYQAEVILRTDIHKRMDTRSMYRRSRRGRKCRYRAPRFLNRAASTRKGRLPPSIKSRSETVVKVAERIASFLPVSEIIVETANFDTQAMRNGGRLRGWEYQRGPRYQKENLKMYVRERDRYTCRYCGEVRPRRLEVDHVIPESRGGPFTADNLVAACHDCNQKKGSMTAAEFGFPEIQNNVKRSLRATAHTQSGKTATINGLAEIAPVSLTYGYITKIDREKMGLPKTHFYDAVAIAARGADVKPLKRCEIMKAVSRGARQQRKGRHSQMNARLPYEVFGFRMWDKVKLPDGTIGFIGARRKSGSFKIKDIWGSVIRDITYKKLELVQRATTLPSMTIYDLKECQ